MPNFTTRVELHYSSSGEDYKKLHSEMEKEGFTRTIKSDDNIVYHLPTAEYDKKGNYSIKQVFDSANLAASRTGKTFAILVTEANNRMWQGLPKA